MDSFAFQFKMGHLRHAAFGRKAIEDKRIKRMTPARYDLLYALRQVASGLEDDLPPIGPGAVGLYQTQLTTTLGVCKAVTSRMLIQLEEMKWIRRERCLADRRRKYVMLTSLGLRMLGKVLRRIVRGNLFRKQYDRYFWHNPALTPLVAAAEKAEAKAKARAKACEPAPGADAMTTGPTRSERKAARRALARAKAKATAAAEKVAEAAAEPPPRAVKDQIYRMWLELEAIARHFGDQSMLQYDYGHVIA